MPIACVTCSLYVLKYTLAASWFGTNVIFCCFSKNNKHILSLRGAEPAMLAAFWVTMKLKRCCNIGCVRSKDIIMGVTVRVQSVYLTILDIKEVILRVGGRIDTNARNGVALYDTIGIAWRRIVGCRGKGFWHSSDPGHLDFLNSEHFLIRRSDNAANVGDIPDNRLNYLKLIKKMRQVFWKCWQKDYLQEL